MLTISIGNKNYFFLIIEYTIDNITYYNDT